MSLYEEYWGGYRPPHSKPASRFEVERNCDFGRFTPRRDRAFFWAQER